jgi:protease I
MATNALSGKRVAVLATNGVEQAELVDPRTAVEQAGASTELLSLDTDDIQAYNHDTEPGEKFSPDKAVSKAEVSDYDGLILPGGVGNPDHLRMDEHAVQFVHDFVTSGRPVAVICHGPWTLVEADVVRGRTLTSYPSVRTDIRNAGGNVVDQEVVIDGNLISSRNPGDLPAFCAALVNQLSR